LDDSTKKDKKIGSEMSKRTKKALFQKNLMRRFEICNEDRDLYWASQKQPISVREQKNNRGRQNACLCFCCYACHRNPLDF